MNSQNHMVSNSIEYQRNNANRVSFRQLMFDISLIILLSTTILSNTPIVEQIDIFQNIKIYSVLIFFLINISAIKSLSYKQIITIIMLGMIAVMCYINSGTTNTLVLFILIISSKNININSTLRLIRNVISISLIILVILSLSGIVTNIVLYKNDNIRYGLGFNHSNIMGYMFLHLCMIDGYVRYNKLRVKDILVLLSIAFIIIYFTYSYSSGFCIILFYALLIISKISNYSRIILIIKKLAIISCPICMFLSIWLAISYKASSSIFYSLNKLVTGRIDLANIYFKVYGITLFGSNIGTANAYISENQLILDNSYMSILIENGLLITVLLLIFNYFAIKKTKVKDDLPLLICIIISAIIGMVERTFLDITTNFTILIMGNILFQTENYRNGIRWKFFGFR